MKFFVSAKVFVFAGKNSRFKILLLVTVQLDVIAPSMKMMKVKEKDVNN